MLLPHLVATTMQTRATTGVAQNDIAQQKSRRDWLQARLDGPVSMYRRGFFHRGALRVDINGTLRDSRVRASDGFAVTPCVRVEKIDYRSFRGSLVGFSFAYCDFHQRNPRTHLVGGERDR